MRYLLAVGEPLVSVTVRFPRVRFRNKDQRLRERAGAYADAQALRFYGEKELWRWSQNRNARVATLLAERKSVMRHKRRHRKLLMDRNRVVKWW